MIVDVTWIIDGEGDTRTDYDVEIPNMPEEEITNYLESQFGMPVDDWQ